MKINTHTIEDLKNGFNVTTVDIIDLQERLEYISNLNNNVIFTVLLSKGHEDSSSYFITNTKVEVVEHIEYMESMFCFDSASIFEHETYIDALDFCKDHCEVHELGLQNNKLNK